MGKVTGFMEFPRELPERRPVAERVNDWFEIYQDFPEAKQKEQGARCMDCGVPFCHTGCPVNNIIPDWNDLVYQGRWKQALRRLRQCLAGRAHLIIAELVDRELLGMMRPQGRQRHGAQQQRRQHQPRRRDGRFPARQKPPAPGTRRNLILHVCHKPLQSRTLHNE